MLVYAQIYLIGDDNPLIEEELDVPDDELNATNTDYEYNSVIRKHLEQWQKNYIAIEWDELD